MHHHSRRPNGSRCALSLLLASTLVPLGSSAVAAERAPTAQLVEEIVVTARRREETLQEVPAAVTVITGEKMFATGNDSMDRLRYAVPNFNFASDMAYRSRSTVRGVGSDRSGAQTNGVGFFIDGVYQSGTARFNAPFFDIERVEVLKGPQGARYGRNAFAGVVNVVTRKPDNEFRASVQTTAENNGGFEGAGMVSMPLIEDQLYLKVSAAHNESDGDYTHDITGKDVMPLESDFYNVRLVWDATEQLEFDLQLSKSDNDGTAYAFASTNSLQDIQARHLLRDNQTSGQDNDEASLIVTWEGEGYTVRNLTAYRDSFTHLNVDGDVTPYDGINSIVQVDSDVWLNELRVMSTGEGPFAWLFGGEIYSSDADAWFPTRFLDEVGFALGCDEPGEPYDETRSCFWNILAGSVATNTIESESDVWSLFAEVSYELWDRLELVASARYDDIDSEVFNAAGGGTEGQFDDQKLQPLFTARYSIDDDTSVYVSAAKGIREGGFNSSSLSQDYGTFDTDELWSYEAGLKKIFPESGARMNISVFYMDADTLNQAAIIRTDAGSLANGALTLGGADSYGAEIDASLPLGGGVTWDVALGLLDCSLKDVPDFEDRSLDYRQVAAGVRSGNECQDSSDWSFNTALVGEWGLGGTGWTATATINLSGKGETRLTTDNGAPTNGLPAIGSDGDADQIATRVFRRDEEIQDPVYLLDLSAGVRNENWTILAFVENLTDQLYALDHYHHEGLCDSGICGYQDFSFKFITTLAPERRYGVRLRYDL
jgi:iron complex outermembrane receptor protein